MAAYAHNFVVSIIGPNGNPIREASENHERTVRLPWESEYKIRLKNKNKVRAKAQVFIDGMDIAAGRSFILNAGESLDLERFVVDGDLDKGSKFKFVNAEKGAATGEIQDPTAPKLGIIEVKFYKEYDWNGILTLSSTFSPPYGTYGGGSILRSAGFINSGATYAVNSGSGVMGVAGSAQGSTNCTGQSGASLNSTEVGLPTDLGGTAMGSDSSQKFQTGVDFLTQSDPITLSIRLKGIVDKPQPKVSATMTTTFTQSPGTQAASSSAWSHDPKKFEIRNQYGSLLEGVVGADLSFNITRPGLFVKLWQFVPDCSEVEEKTFPVVSVNIDTLGDLAIHIAE